MMIDRRAFVAGAALAAVAPAFELLPAQLPSAAADVHHPFFLIDGWSTEDDSPVAWTLWFVVSRSWRTAWR